MSIYFIGENRKREVDCQRAEIDLFQNGQSIADIVVNAETLLYKGLYGRLFIDGYEQNFTVVESSTNGGSQVVRLVSGNATMHHRTSAKQLINVTGRQIIEELCRHDSSLLGSNSNNTTEESEGAITKPAPSGYEYVHEIPSEIANSQHQFFQIINGLEKGEQLTKFLNTFGNQYVWRHDDLGRIIILKAKDALVYTAQGRVEYQNVDTAKLPEPYLYQGSMEDGSVILHIPELLFLPEFGSYLDLEEVTAHTPIPRNKLSDASVHIANEYLADTGASSIVEQNNEVPEIFELYNSYPIEHIHIQSNNSRSIITFVKSHVNQLISSIISRNPDDVFDGTYTGTVRKQNSDGTLQIMPDPPLVQGQGMDKVQIHILPNTKFDVAEGTRVYISFLNSENSIPYVTGFIYPIENSNKLNDQLTITVGNPGNAEFVALSEKVEDELNSLKNKLNSLISKYNAHVHPYGAGSPPPNTLVTVSTETSHGTINSVASRILKSE